jgi:glycosyltransferase involved in cell wall biosynthesis
MRKPSISIVLPTYNGARYIEEAVNSCFKQTINDWELIIVDDCSTDNTNDICDKIVKQDSRIRLIRHNSNLKLPAALNTGFLNANAQFLTWTSDDNCYEITALSDMLDFLMENPSVDLVYTDYTIIDETGMEQNFVNVMPPENLCEMNCIGPCFLFRKTLYELTGGYDESLFLAEDYDFWLRASVLGVFKALHKNLYRYRRHGNSLTNNLVNEIEDAVELTLLRNLAKLSWANKSMKARGVRRIARTARLRASYYKALKYYLKSFLLDPKQYIALTKELFTNRIKITTNSYHKSILL